MCGIIAYLSPQKSDEGLRRHTHHLRHRGPDGQWTLRSGRLHFGYVRLAVVDVSIPIAALGLADDNIVVLFAGEIWNYKELAKDMPHERPATEVNVIRTLYRRYGPAFVSRLDGIFAIVLFDAQQKRCFFIRDSVGVKPLFYYIAADCKAFICASDLKSMCGLSCYRAQVNVDYLRNEYVAGFSDFRDMLFSGARQVEPGECVQLDLSSTCTAVVRVERTHCRVPRFVLPRPEKYEDEQVAVLEAAVQRQYVHSECRPIGLLLSGGIDSSLLLCLARRMGLHDIVCFHVGPANSEDADAARYVARRYGAELVQLTIDTTYATAVLSDAVYYMSGNGIALYWVYGAVRAARPEVKVIWCGEGGDELYAGYEYWRAPGEYFANLAAKIASVGCVTHFFKHLLSVQEQLMRGGDPFAALLEHDLREQLVNGHLVAHDFAAGAHGMEVRLPLLDLSNVAFCRELPRTLKVRGNRQKIMAKRILRRVSGITERRFYERRKKGIIHGVYDALVACRRYAATARQSPLRKEVKAYARGPLHSLLLKSAEEQFVRRGD